MKRFFLVALIAGLALAVATPVQAGYLIIRVILQGGGSDSGPATTGGGPATSAGSFTGTPDGGRPSGSGIGGPPMGSGLGPPGGLQGSASGSGPKPGGAVGEGGIGGTGGSPTVRPFIHDPTRSVVVVIPIVDDLTVSAPFYKRLKDINTNPDWTPKITLTLRNEKLATNIFTDSSTIQLYENLLQTPAPRMTRANSVKDAYGKWSKTKTDPKLLLNAVSTALEAGFVDDAVNYADELLTAVASSKAAPSTDVANFVRAYGAMQKAIKGPATKPTNAEDWRVKLDAKNLVVQGHYALISWDATNEEIVRRSAMLEENFRGFFLTHALRGIELPVPETPLTVVLEMKGANVLARARALDIPLPLPADGFYSSQHDLLVLSPERLDDVGLTFSAQTKQLYREGVSRAALLAGGGPELDVTGQKGKKPADVARLQTLALVERLVEDDSAMHAISREGTRQLLYATQKLPRHVDLPEWLSQGAINTFSRAKDPAFVKSADGKTNIMTVTTTTGYSTPNHALQRYFRDLLDKKDLDLDRAALLKNVITDAYFRGLRNPADPIDPDPLKIDKSGVALHAGGTAPPALGAGGGNQPPTTGGIGQPPTTGGGVIGQPPTTGGTGLGQPPGVGSGLGQPPMVGSGLGQPPGVGSGLGQPPGVGSGLGQPPGVGSGLGQPPTTGGVTQPGLNPAVPPEESPAFLLRKKRDRLDIKAQATSWALYYYLANDKPAELRRFIDDLSALPRDLPLDDPTVVALFCQAFKLDGSKASLATFAQGWLEYVGSVPAVGIDIQLIDPKPLTGTATGGTTGTQTPTGAPPLAGASGGR